MAIISIPFLISFMALFLRNKVVVSQDATSFTVDNFDTQSTDLTYQGDANVPPGSTSLRLTGTSTDGNPTTSSVGRVLYSHPVQFWDAGRQASFETTIRFTITAVDDNPADGIAFFIAPVGSTIPPTSTGGSFGVFRSTGSTFSVFAVEFDTHVNNDVYDPNFRHIGIDTNMAISRNYTRSDDIVGQQVTARINYEAATRTISVVATAGAETYTVRLVADLKAVLTRQVQVGIAASTGGAVAFHDIHSWYFSSTMISDTSTIQQVV